MFDKFHIDIEEVFPQLTNAPIAEAILDIRSVPKVKFEEGKVRTYIEGALGGYHFLDAPREFHHQFKLNGQGPPEQVVTEGLKGVRFQSHDKQHLAQFNRDGFVYSRIGRYDNWDTFRNEATRLWELFYRMSEPTDVNRLGLRFINKIEMPPGEGYFEKYINPAPLAPRFLPLPFYGFMHQDTLAVPGHPYAINLIRTIQQPGVTPGLSLIIDIDVFTTASFPYDEEQMLRHLEEMRWLKDKSFFGSVTEIGLEAFR